MTITVENKINCIHEIANEDTHISIYAIISCARFWICKEIVP